MRRLDNVDLESRMNGQYYLSRSLSNTFSTRLCYSPFLNQCLGKTKFKQKI